jgi:hypothetical protein
MPGNYEPAAAQREALERAERKYYIPSADTRTAPFVRRGKAAESKVVRK